MELVAPSGCAECLLLPLRHIRNCIDRTSESFRLDHRWVAAQHHNVGKTAKRSTRTLLTGFPLALQNRRHVKSGPALSLAMELLIRPMFADLYKSAQNAEATCCCSFDSMVMSGGAASGPVI